MSTQHMPDSLSNAASPQPNFFLVGAAKAGTTSLYNYLAQHPQIFMSPIKEPHFLADEIRAEYFADEHREKIALWEAELRVYLRGPMSERFPSGPVADWQDYLKLFRGAGECRAIGEASPCYLWSKTAPRNMATRFPGAKIIVMLRNPVERAFAQHLHTLSVAKAPMSFSEHVDMALGSTSPKIGEFYPFLEFGFYGQQLRRYCDWFPGERIRVFLYENYLRDPSGLLLEIFRFLDVDETFVPDMSERHMQSRVPRWFGVRQWLRRSGLWQSASQRLGADLRRTLRPMVFRPRAGMALDTADRARMVEFYRAEILDLASLLEMDLSSWLKNV